MRFERIGLAGRRVGEVDRPGPPVLEIRLALDHVGEHRRGSVLEVRHEDLRAGVQGVDDHLAIDRAGDLDAAVEKVGRNRRDSPVAISDRLGFGQKMRQLSGVEQFLTLHSAPEQLEPAAVEAAMEVGEETQSLFAQNFLLPGARLGMDMDSCGRAYGHSRGPPGMHGLL